MQVVVLLLLVASLALLVSGLITGGTPLVAASIVTSLAAAYAISRYRGRQPAAVGAGARVQAGADGARAGARQAGVAGASQSGASRPGAAADADSGPAEAPASGAAAGPSADATQPVRAADLIARQAREQAAEGAAAGELAGEHRAGSEPAGDEPPAAADAAQPSDAGEPGNDADEPPVAETDPPLRSRGDEPVWVIDGRPRYHLSACGFLADRDSEPVPLRQAVGDGFTPCALCDPDSALAAS